MEHAIVALNPWIWLKCSNHGAFSYKLSSLVFPYKYYLFILPGVKDGALSTVSHGIQGLNKVILVLHRWNTRIILHHA